MRSVRAWCGQCGCEQPAKILSTPAVTTCDVCGTKTDHYHGRNPKHDDGGRGSGKRSLARRRANSGY